VLAAAVACRFVEKTGAIAATGLTRWRCRLLDGAASATSRKENEETDERTRERYGADSARKSSPAGDSHDARP
jgi:hypothetical protein